jgi:uncharacterized protein (TIGR02246 family)
MDTIAELITEATARQNDLEPLLALHTDDVVIVNVVGRRVVGKAAFRTAMAEALAGPLADVVTTAEVDDVTFLRPDVALVACTKRIVDRRPGPADALPTQGRLTYVLVDDGEGWRIASAQTTPVRA